MHIRQYIAPTSAFPFGEDSPWETIAHLEEIVCRILQHLDADYIIDGGVAVHRSATVADDAVIHAPAIISEGCYVGSHSVLRGAVFLAPGARVGNCCEVKTSVVLEDSAIAHFNFVGDSIIGRNVNIEAGYLTDVNDTYTFHLISTNHNWAEHWYFAHVSTASVPTGERIVFSSSDRQAIQGSQSAGSNTQSFPQAPALHFLATLFFWSVIPYEITYCSASSFYITDNFFFRKSSPSV